MGKEVKIGLAVILTFGLVFCGVLYQRVSKLKTTKSEVAKAEKPAEKKSDLFASPNKLTAVAADEAEEPVAPARRPFNWSTTEAVPAQPEIKTVEAAPPRASFMPSSEEASGSNNRYDDRYGDRYSKAIPELANQSEPVAEPPTTVTAESAPPATVAESADVAASESTAITPAPSAVSNPFARSTEIASEPPANSAPVDLAKEQPAAPEIAANNDEPVAETPASEPAQPIAITPPSSTGNLFSRSATAAEEPRSEIRIAQEPEGSDVEHTPQFNDVVTDDEEEAPARLDPRTVTAAAASTPAPPASATLYDRPVDRYSAGAPSPSTRATDNSPFRAATATESRLRQESPIATGKYRVGANENFWTVSERAYGTGGYFKALHAYNSEQHPVADDLAVGDELMVPMKSELERQFPELCPKPGRQPQTKSFAMQASAKLPASSEVYVVQEGDTLFDIARYELGKASRWTEIYELNRASIGEDINFLRAGMELVLPDDSGKADAITRQPGSSLR